MDEKLQREILDRLLIIETKLDYVTKSSEKAESAYTLALRHEEEIKEIKDNNKWLWRTAIGAIVTGVIGIGLAMIKIYIGL